MEELDRRNLQNRLIPGNIAFHSRAMDAIRDDALAALAFLDDRAFEGDVPFVSSVTGAPTARLDSAYWWSNIRQPVRFAAAMETVRREHRPDVVLELAPHSALQPIVAQCVEDAASPPVSVPTLMRDTDTRLAFQGALGALFRAGVPLDFAAQYPRPDPIVPLLPGHPRDEQKTVDRALDDEFFLQQSEYAHGPLVGHKIPSDHLLFEARLSERRLLVAGGSPRPPCADHAGSRLHRADTAGPRRRAGPFRRCWNSCSLAPSRRRPSGCRRPCIRSPTPPANTPSGFRRSLTRSTRRASCTAAARCA